MVKGKVFNEGTMVYFPARAAKWGGSVLEGYIECYGPGNSGLAFTLTTKQGREEAKAAVRFILDAVADAQRVEKKAAEIEAKAAAKDKAAKDKAAKKPVKTGSLETPISSAPSTKPKSKKKKSQPWND